MSKRGKVLRIFDNVAAFENLETGNCLIATQLKEGGYRARDLQVCDRRRLSDLSGSSQVIPFEAIFGFYDLLSGPFAAIVIESELHVSVGPITIRKVKKILVTPMFRSGRPLSESKQRDENRFLQLLHLGFAEHSFFFSPTFDITLTQQRVALLSQRELSEPVWMRADKRFFWNRDVVKDLIPCEATQWITPFMSAYVEVRPECEVEEDKFTFLFISRRSKFRQGCRFTKRGLDDMGNCANFVETEQILIFPDGKLCSFVQVRGSIPLKWSSPVLMKYEPNVYIGDMKTSVESAEKHFVELSHCYSDCDGSGEIVCINLIDNKKDQGKLGVAYKEIVDAVQGKLQHKLHYIWFDYHNECKQKGKEKNLDKLLRQCEDHFKRQTYFCKTADGKIDSWQRGVFRTNCMDNLDSTNVVQSMLARRSLLTQLGKLTLHVNAVELDKKLETLFTTVWVHNADAMSFAYAGTVALKTDVVNRSKRTMTGMYNDSINSVLRYYINNLKDGTKQDAIDLLLGNYHPDPMAPSPFAACETQETLSDNIIKVFVLLLLLFTTLLLLSGMISSLVFVIPAWITATMGSSSPSSSVNNFSNTKGMLSSAMIEDSAIEQGTLNQKNQEFRRHLWTSSLVTMSVALVITYKVVKQGSKIGEKLVVHPSLVKEVIVRLP